LGSAGIAIFFDSFWLLGLLSVATCGLALLSGCATRAPQVCKPLPQEKLELAASAREISMSRLRSYRVGTTTEDDFLRAGWRHATIARPYGDIGILSVRGKISAPEWAVIYSEYTLGYVDLFKGQVKLCALRFDATGVLQSVLWEPGSEAR
jgi:hypothetical protein